MKCDSSIYFFLNSANLICRCMDIPKYFRKSLGFRDNESRPYLLFLRMRPLCNLGMTIRNSRIPCAATFAHLLQTIPVYTVKVYCNKKVKETGPFWSAFSYIPVTGEIKNMSRRLLIVRSRKIHVNE